MKNIALIIFGLAHFVLVFHGALKSPWFRGGGLLQGAPRYYADLTGADNWYGFFSPNVGSGSRLKVCWTEMGRVHTQVLELNTHEANLRFGTMVDQLSNLDANQKRNVCASVAGYWWSKHNDSTYIEVIVERFAVPSISEYRKGTAPAWVISYKARFEKV